MNQILSTDMPADKNKYKNKGKKPVALNSILKFFGVSILVFGVCLLGSGVYAICSKQGEVQEQTAEPTISIENKTDNSILLKVICKKNIENVEYSWNDEEKIEVNGNNGKYLEKEITIPSGTNTLHVLVRDIDGKESTYEKQYEKESKIKFEVSENKIKVTYNGDKKISYMTYRWDEEDETKVDINDISIDKEIDVIKGLHELTVVVVDEDNNTDTKTQKINGVSKPKLELAVDEQKQHFIIRTSDEDILAKIEIRLNYDDNQKYVLNLQDKDMKELEYVMPIELKDGENVIEVKVTNSQGISKDAGARFVKE